ncbi:hypothetical protein E2C01_077609 [Portunus trituberculatus]|uniref:Uncharacterized protein n=1 Tax=Portunus trituberculatus TaxID=210409 RepID=A0A5B7IEW8_PORTR|nr:hypothetical protein [Portunus trituberculatus]
MTGNVRTCGGGVRCSCTKKANPDSQQHVVIKTFANSNLDDLAVEVKYLQQLQLADVQRVMEYGFVDISWYLTLSKPSSLSISINRIRFIIRSIFSC